MEAYDDLLITPSESVRKRRKRNVEKWPKLKRFLFDFDNCRILGHDRQEWVRTILYYFSFYTGVIILYTICLSVFTLILDEITPTVRGVNSPMADIPGLSYRPMPDFETNLIRFIQGSPETYKPYSDHVQTFLLEYENDKQVGENFVDCEPHEQRPKDKVCRFNVDDLGGQCTWQKDYGYDEGKPCILVKLNKVIGWMPDLYESLEDIPDPDAREFLETHGGWSPDFMPLSCHGRYFGDEENMGNVTMYPSAGFPKVFYPYLNQEGFRSPVAMIKFNTPSNGVAINIICKVWAKNVPHFKQDNVGTITFTLMVD